MARVPGWMLAGAIITGVTMAVAGCGGGPAKPAATLTPAGSAASSSPSAQAAGGGGKPAQAPPGGFQWVGGPQSVWLAVPDSWIGLNLAKITLSQAASRFAVKGTNVNGASLAADIKQLKKLHALMVEDPASALKPPHFAVNINAYCIPTPIQLIGKSAGPLMSVLRAQYAPFNPQHLSLARTRIDGDPAVKATLTLSTTAGSLTEQQFNVLTQSGRLCTITMSTETPARSFPVFARIASTIQAA
ncbi:MAG TPA: hypothetical protein VH637_07575 [Streptosporangiaceae bacterium]|jgi:hypothetical protein